LKRQRNGGGDSNGVEPEAGARQRANAGDG